MSGRGRPESTLWRRALSTLLVVGLIGGTAAAFAVTERLKLVRSPITDTHVTSWLGRRHGTGRAKLVLRAPGRPGRYRLAVRVGDHAARGVVVVR